MVAERVRLAFQAAGVEISGHKMDATVSIGIATATAPVAVSQLLARADAALYRAKHNGRNRFEHADEHETMPTHEEKAALPRTPPSLAPAGRTAVVLG
jgi:predicted signal transduction protein with EAL and GGDEF domain